RDEVATASVPGPSAARWAGRGATHVECGGVEPPLSLKKNTRTPRCTRHEHARQKRNVHPSITVEKRWLDATRTPHALLGDPSFSVAVVGAPPPASLAAAPVGRPSRMMRDRDDLDFGLPYSIHDVVRVVDEHKPGRPRRVSG